MKTGTISWIALCRDLISESHPFPERKELRKAGSPPFEIVVVLDHGLSHPLERSRFEEFGYDFGFGPFDIHFEKIDPVSDPFREAARWHAHRLPTPSATRLKAAAQGKSSIPMKVNLALRARQRTSMDSHAGKRVLPDIARKKRGKIGIGFKGIDSALRIAKLEKESCKPDVGPAVQDSRRRVCRDKLIIAFDKDFPVSHPRRTPAPAGEGPAEEPENIVVPFPMLRTRLLARPIRKNRCLREPGKLARSVKSPQGYQKLIALASSANQPSPERELRPLGAGDPPLLPVSGGANSPTFVHVLVYHEPFLLCHPARRVPLRA